MTIMINTMKFAEGAALSMDCSNCYEQKDYLKVHGFGWDAVQRTWRRKISSDEIVALLIDIVVDNNLPKKIVATCMTMAVETGLVKQEELTRSTEQALKSKSEKWSAYKG